MTFDKASIRRCVYGGIVFATVAAAPGMAWSACKPGQIQGTWNVLKLWAIGTGDPAAGQAGITFCKLKLNRKGVVQNVGAQCAEAGVGSIITGGQFKLKKSCAIKGEIDLQDEEPVTLAAVRMEPGRTFFSGYATQGASVGIYLFGTR